MTQALGEAKGLGERALGLTDSPEQWEKTLGLAFSAIKRAQALEADEVSPILREEVARVRAELDAAEQERVFIDELNTIKLVLLSDAQPDHNKKMAVQYSEAFRRHGIDVLTLEPTAVVRRLQAYAQKERILAALDHWSHWSKGPKERERLVQIVEVRSGPRSDVVRLPLAETLREAKDRTALELLALEAEGQHLSPAHLDNLSVELVYWFGATKSAVRLLREGLERHPGDFWLNYRLASALTDMRPPQLDEAIRYYTAARALRGSIAAVHSDLGLALKDKGLTDEAVVECRKATEIDPNDAKAHNNLALALHHKGLTDEAVVECRKATEIDPELAEAFNNLGLLYNARGLRDDAIAVCNTALRLKPQYSSAHYNLGIALRAKGHLDEAITHYEAAIRIDEFDPKPYYLVVNALDTNGMLDESIVCYRKALELNPHYSRAYNNLGLCLRKKGTC